ncbi:NADH dehydrogenase [ubiquinone] 1 alpha subcomplex subunit 6 [Habropoda laboriosa]|uniref:NADH dehydrogenase [ubiquinone] 1 alpha subcomplex subunit 6 n=1 Tax=Habropoda laboriosa TaxID=597456 RepID=A0A0L7RJE8_9HYME|nr:PREDICTED: NADH dehydrogenase [ubiquinone] 1 alpha subcomplex subunit 6 [Habropoda laboriosa]KOC70846.1 NADH dehydrogenase [ubiquinone] 1 alpha subcomplex subunit 6 [Habropoda laboriosa]
MAAPVKTGLRYVKPILSLTPGDCRNRVITLYKAWYRQIPYITALYDLPKTDADCRKKLKEIFKRNAHLTDIRTIDILLIKGQMELEETTNMWKPTCTLLYYWNDTVDPKPTDFMSKFLGGQN